MIHENRDRSQSSIVAYDQQGFPLVNVNGRLYTLAEIPQNPPESLSPYFQASPVTPQEKPDPWMSPTWPFILFGSVVAGGVVLIGAVGFFLPNPASIVVSTQQPDQTAVLEMLRQQNATLQGQLGQMQGQNQQLQQQLQAQPKFERHCQSAGFLGLGQDCTEVRR